MKKHISTFFLLILFFSAKSQNVGIGTNTPNQSAALEIKDTSRGILIPRMTMAQRIAIQNPGDGLIVYQVDSTKGFWYWDTEFWKFINSSNIASTGNSTQKIFYRYGFSSSANWICPSDVSQITVELWGAGGTSSPGKACIYNGTGTVNCTSSTKIGGKGGYNKQILDVVPGNMYALTVGSVGGGGQASGFSSNGGSSSFNGIFSAPGGTGAQINGCSADGFLCTAAVNGTDGLVTNYSYVTGPSVTIPNYIPASGFLSNTSVPGCCAPADTNGFIILSYFK